MIESLVVYALSLVGTPYIWGGNLPFGVDCSGYAGEIGKAGGFLPSNADFTSQGIYDYFVSHDAIELPEATIGAFVFYGKSLGEITHVGFAIDNFSMLSAAGGDSSTNSMEKAMARKAFVKQRPIRYRKDLVAILLPKFDSP